jgi:hypothetical protein
MWITKDKPCVIDGIGLFLKKPVKVFYDEDKPTNFYWSYKKGEGPFESSDIGLRMRDNFKLKPGEIKKVRLVLDK